MHVALSEANICVKVTTCWRNFWILVDISIYCDNTHSTKSGGFERHAECRDISCSVIPQKFAKVTTTFTDCEIEYEQHDEFEHDEKDGHIS